MRHMINIIATANLFSEDSLIVLYCILFINGAQLTQLKKFNIVSLNNIKNNIKKESKKITHNHTL